MQKINLIREPNINAKYDAFPYQNDAVNAVKDLEYAAIFHEQGLGKTKIAIDLMLYWLKNKEIDTVLYVTKKGLVQNWKNEFKAHTYMKPRVLNQDASNNYFALNSPTRMLLTHYEVIQSEKERLKIFLKTRNVAIIVDEATKIKNPESSITKAFFELSALFAKRVIMTGTPAANRPFDIWAQIYFLDNGKTLGKDFIEFKKSTDLENDFNDALEKRERFEKETASIYKKIEDFCVRETKNSNVINLPQKIITKVITSWETSQYAIYWEIQKELRTVILKDGVLKFDESSDVLKRLLRLIQVASNPKLINDLYKNTPGKVDALCNLLHLIISNGEKCIVWTNFVDNVEYLIKYFQEYNSVKIHGNISMNERNKAIELFMNDPDTLVLFATPASAKEGLTLTSANHAIFFDRTFSLDDYLQAQDRIHRISQKRTCYIYNLVMENSIDEWIDILINSKHLAAQLAQGDIDLETFKTLISYDYGEMIKDILSQEV